MAEPRSGRGSAAGSESEPDEDVDGGPLDVRSPHFNPYLALYSPRPPPLPFPYVRTFNNVAEYESFLHRRCRARTPGPTPARTRSGRRAARAASDPDRIERLKKLMVSQPDSEEKPRCRRRDRAPKNVMTRMARAARLLHLERIMVWAMDTSMTSFRAASLLVNKSSRRKSSG